MWNLSYACTYNIIIKLWIFSNVLCKTLEVKILIGKGFLSKGKVIQYTKFRVCTIAWNEIENSELAASSYIQKYVDR